MNERMNEWVSEWMNGEEHAANLISFARCTAHCTMSLLSISVYISVFGFNSSVDVFTIFLFLSFSLSLCLSRSFYDSPQYFSVFQVKTEAEIKLMKSLIFFPAIE